MPGAIANTTGKCFCGCDRKVTPGSFFVQGHDKKAEGDLNAILHGDAVVNRLVYYGYGPGQHDLNLHERAIELGLRERCGVDGCNVSGVPGSAGMRRHRATHQEGAPSASASD